VSKQKLKGKAVHARVAFGHSPEKPAQPSGVALASPGHHAFPVDNDKDFEKPLDKFSGPAVRARRGSFSKPK
jgi:hypothetical protein